MKTILPVLLCLMALASCNPDSQECYVPKPVTAQIGFTIIDTIFAKDQLGRDSIYVSVRDTPLNYPSMLSLGNDTVIRFMGVYKGTQLPVMFNPETDSIRYRFQPDSTQQIFDTVTLHYDHNYHFISNACGYTYYYNINRVKITHHLLDSARIATPSVTQSAQDKHVILYFID